MRPVALITGASAGIGKTFARRLAGLGFDLIVVARRADRLAELAAELAAGPGGPVTALAADLATEEGLQAVEAAIADCPRLELLVNNAGFGTLGRFWETDAAGQEAMHRLHVIAPMRLGRAALAGMTARNRGAIINVSSVAAFGQSEGNVSYCATKAWMTSFTEGLAIELVTKQSPVRLQALCPGFTYSEFHDRMGVDRNPIPKQLWMTADFVVAESLRGFDRGQVVVVPGWRYKIIVAFIKAMPGPLMRRIAAVGARRYRKPIEAKP
jgi:hypothetical protein